MTDQRHQLVTVAYASDEAEAELLQGLLRLGDVESVVRRAPGFDAPSSERPGRATSSSPHPTSPPRETSYARSTRVSPGRRRAPAATARAALLLAVALVVIVICVAANVFP